MAASQRHDEIGAGAGLNASDQSVYGQDEYPNTDVFRPTAQTVAVSRYHVVVCGFVEPLVALAVLITNASVTTSHQQIVAASKTTYMYIGYCCRTLNLNSQFTVPDRPTTRRHRVESSFRSASDSFYDFWRYINWYVCMYESRLAV